MATTIVPSRDQVQPDITPPSWRRAIQLTLKLTVCLLLATAVTVLLFRLDSLLVSQPKTYDTMGSKVKLLDFVRVEPSDYIRVKERRLPRKPPPTKRPPPPPKVQVQSDVVVETSPLDFDMPDIEVGFGGSGPYLGAWRGPARAGPNRDGDVIPIVRIAPQYPRQALLEGIEGWVRIEFIINPDGTVAKPSVKEADPPRVFNTSALRAILRWKFKPRIVDGKAVSRRGEQVIEFKLEDHV
jgi:protein TonB